MKEDAEDEYLCPYRIFNLLHRYLLVALELDVLSVGKFTFRYAKANQADPR